MKLVSIIDYGCGNIKSVFNAFSAIHEKNNLRIQITSKENEIKNSSHIVLPGVGSYESCVEGLKNSNLLGILSKKVLEDHLPFLGICVGMQMLSSQGFENGIFKGLNWIKGDVKKIKKSDKNLKIPHMGWNSISVKRETNFTKKLMNKIDLDKANAYFVHSYNFSPENNNYKIMTTNYEQEITAMVCKKNIIGTQFHPEKSHVFGLKFLETFLELEEF